MGEARATKVARIEGYRPQVLSLLQRARRLETPNLDPIELRQLAVDCLGDFMGLPPAVIDELPAEVSTIALRPSARHVAVGMHNGTIDIYDIDTAHLVSRLSGHSLSIRALDFDGDGTRLVSVDLGGMVKDWRFAGQSEWSCTRTFRTKFAITSAVISVDVDILVTTDGVRGYSVDLETGDVIAQFDVPGGQYQYRHLTLNHDGSRLAITTPNGIGVWNPKDGQLQRLVPATMSYAYQAAFNSDSSLLACANEEGLFVLDLPLFQRRSSLRSDTLVRVAFQPHSDHIAFASVSKRIRLWNVSTNRDVAVLRYPGPREIRALAFRRDGKLLAAADFRSIRVWDLMGTGERIDLRGHAGGVSCAVFSQDGKWLATGSKDLKEKIWDTSTGELVKTIGPTIGNMQSVGFSPDGCLLATAGWAGAIQIWDWQAEHIVAEPSHHLGTQIWKVGFSPDGRSFACAGKNGLELWAVPEDLEPDEFKRNASQTWKQLVHLRGSNSRHLCFSPDSNYIVFNERDGGTLRIWDMRQQREIPFHGPPPLRGFHNVAFLADGRRIAYISKAGLAQVWDIVAGQSDFVLGEPGVFQDWHVSVSPNGRWLLGAKNGNLPGVWDLQTRNQLFEFPELHSPAWSLDWSPDSNLMAIGQSDGGVSIWSLSRIRAHLTEMKLDWSDEPTEGRQ
jgi:WD40 repeat protein